MFRSRLVQLLLLAVFLVAFNTQAFAESKSLKQGDPLPVLVTCADGTTKSLSLKFTTVDSTGVYYTINQGKAKVVKLRQVLSVLVKECGKFAVGVIKEIAGKTFKIDLNSPPKRI